MKPAGAQGEPGTIALHREVATGNPLVARSSPARLAPAIGALNASENGQFEAGQRVVPFFGC